MPDERDIDETTRKIHDLLKNRRFTAVDAKASQGNSAKKSKKRRISLLPEKFDEERGFYNRIEKLDSL